jgi:hypothetical protein
MILSCGDSDEVVTVRRSGLTIVVATPADHRAIRTKGKTMSASGSDTRKVF